MEGDSQEHGPQTKKTSRKEKAKTSLKQALYHGALILGLASASGAPLRSVDVNVPHNPQPPATDIVYGPTTFHGVSPEEHHGETKRISAIIKVQSERFNEQAASFSKLLGKYWGEALRGPGGESSGDEYFSSVSRDTLYFAHTIRGMIEYQAPWGDVTYAERMHALATYKGFEMPPPPMPSPAVRSAPESGLYNADYPTDHFESPFFGPVEFSNLRKSELKSLNTALILALAIAENGPQTSLSNITTINENFGDQIASSWGGVANTHIGRDAIRYITGLTNSRHFGSFGSKNYEVFPHNRDGKKGLFLLDPKEYPLNTDRIMFSLQELLIGLRAMNYEAQSGKTDVDLIDESGNLLYLDGSVVDLSDLSNVDYERLFLRRYYPPNDTQVRRVVAVYKAIQELSQEQPELTISLLTTNLADFRPNQMANSSTGAMY